MGIRVLGTGISQLLGAVTAAARAPSRKRATTRHDSRSCRQRWGPSGFEGGQQEIWEDEGERGWTRVQAGACCIRCSVAELQEQQGKQPSGRPDMIFVGIVRYLAREVGRGRWSSYVLRSEVE